MDQIQNASEKEPFPWHLGVFDAHCHPTDTVPSIDDIPHMKSRVLTIMATRGQDQDLVVTFADRLGISKDTIPSLKATDLAENPTYVLPSFGWHPWFSYQIYDDRDGTPLDKEKHYREVLSPSPEDDVFIQSLPEPRSLSALLFQVRGNLERYPCALVGEVGLDRAFRIPVYEVVDNQYVRDPTLTPGGREGRKLSHYRVDIDHQRTILRAQLDLAGEMQRAVSVHGVAAHGVVFESLRETWRAHPKPVLSKRERKRIAKGDAAVESKNKLSSGLEGECPGIPKSFPPRICLHSYSGPPDTLKQYLHPSIPAKIFFSFSSLVNFSSHTSKKAIPAIQAVPDDRILAESDLHAGGKRMDDLLEDIVRTICHIKRWSLENGVKQLASNWMDYAFGNK